MKTESNHNLVQFQKILDDHIEQMSKNLENVSNGQDKFTFKVYDRCVLTALCERSRQIFKNEPNILNIKGECIVVGDIHGHIIDLYRIFTTFDLPPKTTYLFLGDIVDRGGFSLETITLILVLKILFPNSIYIIRGNHEFDYSLFTKKQEVVANSLYSEILHSYQADTSCRQKSYHQAIQQRLGSNSNSPNKNSASVLPELNNSEDKNSTVDSPDMKKSISPSLSASRFNSFSQTMSEKQLSPNMLEFKMPNQYPASTLQLVKNSSFEGQKPALCTDSNDILLAPHEHADQLFDQFVDTFSFMPLATKFGESIICIHGGIGGSFSNVQKDLSSIERPILDFENNTVENILWSDPLDDTSCDYDHINFLSSPRGRGCLFSKKAFDSFMRKNNLKLMLRGHQCVDGIQIQYNSHLITVFSASNYCGFHSNKSGIVKILSNKSIRTYTFQPFHFVERNNAVFLNTTNGRAFGALFVYPKHLIPTSYSVDLSRREFNLLPYPEVAVNKGVTKYVSVETLLKPQQGSNTNSLSFDNSPSSQNDSEASQSKPTERRRIVIVKPKINTNSLL